MLPEQVRPKHIARYLDERGKTAPVAANRDTALLSHVFKKCVRWGYCETNSCSGIERHSEKPRERYIIDDEFVAVRNIAPEHIQILMDLAYLTGQRQADLIKIKLSDISDDGIFFKQNKTGKKLIVEWSNELRSVVDHARGLTLKVKHLSAYLVHNRDGYAYKSSSIQTAWQRLMTKCIESGVLSERFQFKDIRAKARSDGEDKRLLGHSNPEKMAKIYQRKAEKVKPVK